MNATEFKTAKKRIMREYRPSSRGNLVGKLADFSHYLEQSRVIIPTRVRKTADIGCRLEATCRPRSPSAAAAEIAAELERIWLEDLRYEDFGVHTMSRSDQEVCLDFITLMEDAGLYVAGCIVVAIAD